jgi:probable F420-dependent oxidoreductase
MRFGIHLPQYGRAAGPDAIREAAMQAEQLGFADVWVSDHIAVPDGAPYPPPFIYDPLLTLAWAAAATRYIGLGTSVLVLPLRNPVGLAKELASLDALAGGRLIVGAASGWLEAEFNALGIPFDQRGSRTDEAIAVLRACWAQRPVEFHGRYTDIRAMRVEPRPARRIPIWIGGTSTAARRRAVSVGDGWHGIGIDAHAVAPLVTELRAVRSGAEFVISLRMTWDGITDSADLIREHCAALSNAGVQHIVAAPSQSELHSWMKSVERLAEAFGLPI